MYGNRSTKTGQALAAFALLVSLPAPAGAQPAAAAADPNTGALTLTGSFDVVSTYMFRGIRQNSTGAMWPALNLGLALYSGDGALKSASVNVGTWNSLHTGHTGSDGPSGKLWYESDFYAASGLGFGKGVTFTTTDTAYTSPARTPAPISRSAAPGYSMPRASVALPIKAGFSLSDYYELNGEDHTFGFFSIAGIVTVPLGGMTGFGAWNVHGGVEYQALGDTTQFFNGGDSSRVIGSTGVGFTY